jgi:alkaline phosphatase D
MPVDRRTLLAASAVGAAGVALGSVAADHAQAATRYFHHGVASGDPRPRSVILWTRVTPTDAATPGSGKGPRVRVAWQVAEDRGFRDIVARGTVRTGPGRDHTVKLDAKGLRPGHSYFYRFLYQGVSSPIGRTKTAPARRADISNLRFGVVSCSNMPAGYFSAYRHLAARDDLDAVLHLGDYLYEYGPGEYGDLPGRQPQPPREMVSLADYRQRHAQYKSDRDLQALHSKYPFIVTWDDHEVTNDQWRKGAENHQPETEGDYLERRARAHKAYDEWMPVRMGRKTDLGDGTRLFRRLKFGKLAEISMLDLRTYRSQQQPLVEPPGEPAPGRTITGNRQMEWLKESLREDRAVWKLVGNPVMIAPVQIPPLPPDLLQNINDVVHLLPEEGQPYNVDQWDGYTEDRRELFTHLRDHGVHNTVFLTGDIHSGWACDLPVDASIYEPRTGLGESVGTEFVCTSVTSDNLNDITMTAPARSSLPVEAALMTLNRHVRYVNFDDHGFSVLEVTRRYTQMDYYVISDREDPRAEASVHASYRTRTNSQTVHRTDDRIR